MIRSMTGFGREHRILNGREILVEIRSVNHRYYEFTAKLPRAYMYLEDKLKTLLQGKISRGKVEISVSVYNVDSTETKVSVNRAVVGNYIEALRNVSGEFSLKDNLSLSDVFKMTDAFNIVRSEEDEENIWHDVSEVASAALDKFISMRETEGVKLYEDVTARLATIENSVGEVERLAPETVTRYREKLTEKMNDILNDKQIDSQRILLEAALFADKIAVDEETVRLRSHISQYREMLTNEDIVGRKLDFLTQELNRECNTIGSKSQNLEVTRIVVDMKSEIEKIREQIQNIE